MVVSCVVSGNSLPDFLLHPLDCAEGGSGSSCGGGGGGGGGGMGGGMASAARVLSRSSRGSASLESGGGPGFSWEYLRGECE